MKALRDYQEVACDYISKRLGAYKRPFIYCLACGTGKSLVIAELAKRHGKVLVLTLSAELCKQDYDECVEYGVKASVIKHKACCSCDATISRNYYLVEIRTHCTKYDISLNKCNQRTFRQVYIIRVNISQ